MSTLSERSPAALRFWCNVFVLCNDDRCHLSLFVVIVCSSNLSSTDSDLHRWCTGEADLHPSMPNAATIQAALNDLRDRELMPFIEPGNRMARSLYVDLPLPWTLSSPVTDFDQGTFFRKEVIILFSVSVAILVKIFLRPMAC